jgi:hypothetical protein
MEPELLRTGLNGSALVELLAQLALTEGPAAAPAFVEGLGRWLGWEDAIALSAALQTPDQASLGLTSPVRARKLALQLQRDYERLRTALCRALDDDGTTAGDTDFAPYGRHYAAQQHAMAEGIAPLRTQARAAVALMSPNMFRLAAMDTVVEQALGRREQGLLAMLPTLLERHFTRLRLAHEAAPTAPTCGKWLNTFRQDMRRLGRAELELRLLPVQGLLDTMQTMKSQTDS